MINVWVIIWCDVDSFSAYTAHPEWLAESGFQTAQRSTKYQKVPDSAEEFHDRRMWGTNNNASKWESYQLFWMLKMFLVKVKSGPRDNDDDGDGDCDEHDYENYMGAGPETSLQASMLR